MNNSKNWIIITTINHPTDALLEFAKLLKDGWSIVVVGDIKTPHNWSLDGVHFLSIERQTELFGNLSEIIPIGHYSRKNLGYIYAIERGAELIIDTDDDNFPMNSFGQKISRVVKGNIVGNAGWVNIYKYFSQELIWPRGLPLTHIHQAGTIVGKNQSIACDIQQFLVNLDPDVDAVHRLLFPKEYNFNSGFPVILDEGAWCPFNSQNTIFHKKAFPLLYLPCQVSFRMTDIWRSFVAQAVLGKIGGNISFHEATAYQVRNEHDLMQDFNQEIVGYVENNRIYRMLVNGMHNSKLKADTISELALTCFRILDKENIIEPGEIEIAMAWHERLQSLL